MYSLVFIIWKIIASLFISKGILSISFFITHSIFPKSLFLKKNHIQGNCGSIFDLGLYYENVEKKYDNALELYLKIIKMDKFNENMKLNMSNNLF